MIPDANLLLYACDESFPTHAAARSWWELTVKIRRSG
jgi:predicted nucleic acid-binding protein